MILTVNGQARDEMGRFCRKPKDLATYKFKLPREYAGDFYCQTTRKYTLHKTFKVKRCELVNAINLKKDPELHTYLVMAWGEFERPYGFSDTWLNGSISICKELEYSDVIKEHIKALESSLFFEDLEANKLIKRMENNIGSKNVGVRNVGDQNYGIANMGIRNYGIYNKGVNIMGCFNTRRTSFYMFNKPMKENIYWDEVYELLPDFLLTNFKREIPDFYSDDPSQYETLTVKEAFARESQRPDWDKELEKLYALPNFDYAVFEDITGISREMLDVSYDNWKKKFGKKGKKRK